MEIQPLITSTAIILDKFDLTDPKNIGRPFYWDMAHFCTTLKMMICSDNISGALRLIDPEEEFLPAWYREPENYPKELTEIKSILFRNLYDQYDYANDFDEANYSREGCREQYKNGYFYPRADIVKDVILKMNANGQVPWICELSPSHGAMVLGLLEDGCKFTFFGKNLNSKALDRLKAWIPDGIWQDTPSGGQQKILISFESIEHIWREKDIEHAAYKIGLEFDQIFISAPLGTLGGGLPNFETRRLGHIRTYTAKDLLTLSQKFFSGYFWSVYKTSTIIVHGLKS